MTTMSNPNGVQTLHSPLSSPLNTRRDPITIRKPASGLSSISFSSSLDNSYSLTDAMSSPPRRPMSPTFGGAAAAMKKFLRRRRAPAGEFEAPQPSQLPQQQQQQQPQPMNQFTMGPAFVLVGGVGAESGATVYDVDHFQLSSPPCSPHPVALTHPPNNLVTPPTSPMAQNTENNTCTSHLNTTPDRGRGRVRGTTPSPLGQQQSSIVSNAPGQSSMKTMLHNAAESTYKSLRRSLSADAAPIHHQPFQSRNSSRHCTHQNNNNLGLDSAMEFMLNKENLEVSPTVTPAMKKKKKKTKTHGCNSSSSDRQEDKGDEDMGCPSTDISFSSLLATDLEMLDSLKNEHRQGGSGKKTMAKERNKKEQEQKQPVASTQVSQSQQRRVSKSSSIYHASMEFLAIYHGPAHTGLGNYSSKHLKKATEQGRTADWSAIERSIPDLSSSSVRPRLTSGASASSVAANTKSLLIGDDMEEPLASTWTTPTQYYRAPKTRKALRCLVTDNEYVFCQMLEHGFLWSTASDLVEHLFDDHSYDDDGEEDEDEEDFVENPEQSFSLLSLQYFMTLRITLTPWHARADEAEIYGSLQSKLGPSKACFSKRSSMRSITSSALSTLSNAASTTTRSFGSLNSVESVSSASSVPAQPSSDESLSDSECVARKSIRSAPLILERSSSLRRCKGPGYQTSSPGANLEKRPKYSGPVPSPPHPAVLCSQPIDTAAIHPFDSAEGMHTDTLLERSSPPSILKPSLLSLSPQEQPLPLRKGSLSPFSLPRTEEVSSTGTTTTDNNNNNKTTVGPVTPPVKSKDRPVNEPCFRPTASHDSTISPPMVPPRRKGSTPALFYTPPKSNNRSHPPSPLMSPKTIQAASTTTTAVRRRSIAPSTLTLTGSSSSSSLRQPRKATDYVAPSLRAAAAARQHQYFLGSIPIRKQSDQSDIMSASLAAARRINAAETERGGGGGGRVVFSMVSSSPQLLPQQQRQQQQEQQQCDFLPHRQKNPVRNLQHSTRNNSPAAAEDQQHRVFCIKSQDDENEKDEEEEGEVVERLTTATTSLYPSKPTTTTTMTTTTAMMMTVGCSDSKKLRRQIFYETTTSGGDLSSASCSSPGAMPTTSMDDYSSSSLTMSPLSPPPPAQATGKDTTTKNDASPPSSPTVAFHHPPFTVSGVSVKPRSVQRHVVKVDRGFVITNNNHNHSCHNLSTQEGQEQEENNTDMDSSISSNSTGCGGDKTELDIVAQEEVRGGGGGKTLYTGVRRVILRAFI
ncbi:hypothetical protein BG004_001685 [Podila humilis]|nr:hypothetical protein BG004_001685 [Podila humilis]